MYDFHVTGNPGSQGSKRHVGNGRMIESSRKVKPWRAAVKDAAKVARGSLDPLDCAVVVTVDFYLPAPAKSKFGDRPAGPPDLDKICRSTGDALEASGIITNDSRIIKWIAQKHWALDEPGAHIRIRAADSLPH